MAEPQLSEREPKDVEVPEQKAGFWRRQFQSEVTYKQKRFDWIFGVIMPTVCFAFDPGIFRNEPARGALFGDYTPFAYLLSFTLIMATMAMLLFGDKFKSFNAILSGLFMAGGITALVIGVFLFPFSLIGLIFLIGILGFTPLLTSFVYLRNARRTFRDAKPHFRRSSLIGAFVFSSILTATIPAVFNAQIHRLITEMKTGDMSTIRANAMLLKFIPPLVNTRSLVNSGCDPNGEDREASKAAYFELTGLDIKDSGYFNCND